MESLVPAEAVIPEMPILPETQITQEDLAKAAEARGKLIEELG